MTQDLYGRVIDDENTPADFKEWLDELCKSLNAGIWLLGQGINKISYHQRLQVLSAIARTKEEAKQKFKEKEDLLGEDKSDQLFGAKFREATKTDVEDLKATCKTLGLNPTKKTEGKGKQPKKRADNTSPFKSAPSLAALREEELVLETKVIKIPSYIFQVFLNLFPILTPVNQKLGGEA